MRMTAYARRVCGDGDGSGRGDVGQGRLVDLEVEWKGDIW